MTNVSPALLHMASNVRELKEVRCARLPRLFYTVLFSLPDQIRLLSPESDLLESEAEVLKVLWDKPRTWKLAMVIKHEDDSVPEIVTDHFRGLMDAELAAAE